MTRRMELAFGVGGYLALLGASLWEGERLADPLPEALALIVLAAGIVLAAALVRDWWFTAMSLVVLAWLAGGVDNPLELFFIVALAIPATAALLAIGVGLGRLGYSREHNWRPRAVAASLAACIALPAVAAGYDTVRPARDLEPSDPLTVDWRTGEFDHIALGMQLSEVEAGLGEPGERGLNQPGVPLGEDYYEIGGPTSFRAPFFRDEDLLRYHDLAVFTARAQVYGWVSTSSRAETREGVGIGDSRELVARRYSRAQCSIANEGTEYATFPLCIAKVCEGRQLFFGGEPIRSIWLIAQTRAGLRGCENPEPPR